MITNTNALLYSTDYKTEMKEGVRRLIQWDSISRTASVIRIKLQQIKECDSWWLSCKIFLTYTFGRLSLSLRKTWVLCKMISHNFCFSHTVPFQKCAPPFYRQLSFKFQSIVNQSTVFLNRLKQLLKIQKSDFCNYFKNICLIQLFKLLELIND